MKTDLGRRPRYMEMYLQCRFVDVNIAREFGGYIGLLKQTEELSTVELDVYTHYATLLTEIEKTTMTKSYKMVEKYVKYRHGDMYRVEITIVRRTDGRTETIEFETTFFTLAE